MAISPYLFFEGRCREAMTFYAGLLDGEIEAMMTSAEAPPDARMPGSGDQIMHACLRIGDERLMASDSPPEFFRPMQGFFVAFTAKSIDDAERIWAGLSDGATSVAMEMAETFWADRFGMLTDRFGTPWMVQFPKPT